MIIDGDGHLYEPRDLWRDHTTARDRHVALSIEDDPLGYSWVTFRGQAITVPAWVATPTAGRDFTLLGNGAQAWREGLPNPLIPYDDMPADYSQAQARVASLDGWGIDECVLFPQWGFMWESRLAGDPHAVRVNMEAWNRFAVEVAQDGGGRLHPVGHVRLAEDPRWLDDELRRLAAAGIHQVMMSPGLIHGKRPSDPMFDPIWASFVEHRMALTWHVNQQMRSVLTDVNAWTDNDEESIVRLVTMPFTRTAVELALTDMALNGVFQRFPELRVVTAELGAEWFPVLCRRLDGAHRIWEENTGRTFNDELTMTPGEYLRRAVTIVCSFPTDANAEEMEAMSETLAFGGDYPHPEGLSRPLADYEEIVGAVSPETYARVYGGNLEPILHP